MKIKDKKTGEIIELALVLKTDYADDREVDTLFGEKITVKNFANLFEDYENPEEYWSINSNGELLSCMKGISEDSRRPIGNYFETREEAEKALEKLKALKRLKDKGFEFKGCKEECWQEYNDKWCLSIIAETNDYDEEEIALLFGGEE